MAYNGDALPEGGGAEGNREVPEDEEKKPETEPQKGESEHAEHAERIAGHLDLPDEMLPHVIEHLQELLSGKAPIIWIQGQNCSGCTVTLLNSNHFQLRDLISGKLCLRYNPTLMAADGFKATDIIEETERDFMGKYIVVLEGSVPTGEGEAFCTFGLTETTKKLCDVEAPGDRTVFDWLLELIPGAEAVMAVGNCAAYGGIPMMESDVTGATPATEVVEAIDPDKPVINVAGCPPHPDWIMGTLVDLLLWVDGHKDKPILDDKLRLKRFYEAKVHDQCERKPAFEAKRFLEDWNDCQEDEDRCLLMMGCKGPRTFADCPARRWNFDTEWCVAVNAPCHGCTEPDFHEKLPHPK